MIFPIGSRGSKGVIRYVIDPSIARAISEGNPLTRTHLYEAQTDYITGCDIKRKYEEWDIDQVRVEIVKQKNQLVKLVIIENNRKKEMFIESSLLYTREDGAKDFVHLTYKEFFLAKWFADKINQGELSVKKAYKKYWRNWSYTMEMITYWAIHPGWRPTVRFLSGLLNVTQAKQLAKLLTTYFHKAEKRVHPQTIDGFFHDFLLFSQCFNDLRLQDPIMKERTVVSLLDCYGSDPKGVRDALIAIGGEEVCKRVVHMPYEYEIGRQGYLNHLLYILCNTDYTKETLARHLKELLGNINLEDIINLNGRKLYRELCRLYGNELEKAHSKKRRNYYKAAKDKDFYHSFDK